MGKIALTAIYSVGCGHGAWVQIHSQGRCTGVDIVNNKEGLSELVSVGMFHKRRGMLKILW